MKKRLVNNITLFLIGSLILIITAAFVNADCVIPTRQDISISADQADAIALKHREGIIKTTVFEDIDCKSIWKVTLFHSSGAEIVVTIDATSGTISNTVYQGSIIKDSSEYIPSRTKLSISSNKAKKIATEHRQGVVKDVTFEDLEETSVWKVFMIQETGAEILIIVDAVTGEILSTKYSGAIKNYFDEYNPSFVGVTITSESAELIALNEVSGIVKKVSFDEDKAVWKVVIFRESGVESILTVSAVNGKILGKENYFPDVAKEYHMSFFERVMKAFGL